MDVRSMHIEVQQSLQQVAANRSRKYLPEEIDWVLNKMVERFIQSRLRPKTDAQGRPTGGFEIDQLQADAIRMLLVTGRELTPYAVSPTRYKCFLPPDYTHLIADWSFTTELCGKLPAETNRTLFITRLRQDLSAKAAPPYYASLIVQMPDKTVNIPAELPYGNSYAGLPEKDDIAFLVPWVRWKGGWYWERFDDLYYPKHYLQVQETAPGAAATTVDGTNYSEDAVTTRAYKVHAGTGQLRTNRLSPSEIVPSLLQSAYYGTSHYSPVSELSGNILWIHKAPSFTVNSVQVSYIRKPQPISLSLNTDCELAPDFHQTICDLAVEYLKGRVENEKGTVLAKADLAERVIL